MELASRIQRFVEHAHSQKQKQMAITEPWKWDGVERDGKNVFFAVPVGEMVNLRRRRSKSRSRSSSRRRSSSSSNSYLP